MFKPSRIPNNLSHTAMTTFEQNREEFFFKYLAGTKTPRAPQDYPASVGSSFDAVVKAELHHDLGFNDPAFEFEALFEQQVEAHNRDFARIAGRHVFESYVACGAYADILALLQKSTEDPRFEFSVQRTINGIPLMGKPDLKFRLDCSVIGDWKVKSYCSKYAASPTKNYRMCRDGFTPDKPNKKNGLAHKDYVPFQHHGIEINRSYLEQANDVYADQMCMYGWLLGEPVGDENTAFFMEEIVAKPYVDPVTKTTPVVDGIPSFAPTLRIANHRARVSAAYQHKLLARYQAVWDACQTGYVFTDMTREENDERCAALDETAKTITEDDFFTAATRSGRW